MRRGGFTLIETLVVISIIALLVAILLPALVAGKDRGQTLVCQSNLKQNAMLMLAFVQNQGQYPFAFCSSQGFSTAPPGGFIGQASNDWQGWWWFHQYADSKKPTEDASLRCPSQMQTENILCGNYGVNYAVCKIGDSFRETDFYGSALKASRLGRPGRTLLLMDSGYTLASWKVALPDEELEFENPLRKSSFFLPGLAVNARRTIAPAQQADALKGRHPGRSVNAAFADGHVKSLSAANLAIADPNEGSLGRLYHWLP